MFQFDLQALLELRQANEEKKQTELAETMRKLEIERAMLTDITKKRLQMIQEYYELEGKPTESLRFGLYSKSIALYREMEIAQEEKCYLAEKEAEEKRFQLIEASKQKKMIETLKEKKIAAYQQDLNMKEGKELDEAALLRYGGGPS